MPASPAPADPGWDDDLAWLDRDPERDCWLDRAREHDDLPEPGEEEHEDHYPFTAEELAEIRDAAADELLAVEAASTGRRGPGQPGSARVFPGESSSPAAAFGPGMVFDVLPGCAQLAVAADAAAGDDRFAGVSEAELIGVVCAWDRVEAARGGPQAGGDRASWRAVTSSPGGREFTADQVACALGESRFRADELTGTAGHLDTHLPGTRAALRDGTLSLGKARIIATATGLLDEAEARAAEAGVLDRAGRLTPGGLRAAIARAVMEAAPKKAKKRRETAAKFARVERWAEDSGNAALAGRELSPDQVLAADERITAWAQQLRNAGLEGGMDELRARALLDLLLGQDSRPRPDRQSPGRRLPARPARPARPGTGRVRRPGHADRPAGHLDPPGGPARRAVRPGPGRPLADPRPGRRRRGQPRTTWCLTVTDGQGHAVAHGCARPEPRQPPETRRPRPARRHRVLLHPGQPGRAARRVRHLAAAHPRTRAGPDHHDRPGYHRPLRPPARNQPPRSRGQAAAPGPGPARHLHQPHLPAARRPVRPRAQHPLRSRRP